MPQQADHDDNNRRHPDSPWSQAVDGGPLDQTKRYRADRSQTHDHPQVPFIAPRQMNEVRISVEQADGRHHEQVQMRNANENVRS